MQRIKRIILSAAAALALLAPVAMPAMAGAQSIEGGLNCGAEFNVSSIGSGNASCATQGGDPSERVNNILKLVINIFSLIVGVVAVIMIIIGGLKYITSGGDSGNVSGAKNTILYAIIGLVIVALAQVIVRFVLQKATQTA